jgi:hypothetical protein
MHNPAAARVLPLARALAAAAAGPDSDRYCASCLALPLFQQALSRRCCCCCPSNLRSCRNNCTSAQRHSQQSSQLQLLWVHVLQKPLLLTALHLQATAACASLTYCTQKSGAAAHCCLVAAAADQLHCCCQQHARLACTRIGSSMKVAAASIACCRLLLPLYCRCCSAARLPDASCKPLHP